MHTVDKLSLTLALFVSGEFYIVHFQDPNWKVTVWLRCSTLSSFAAPMTFLDVSPGKYICIPLAVIRINVLVFNCKVAINRYNWLNQQVILNFSLF